MNVFTVSFDQFDAYFAELMDYFRKKKCVLTIVPLL